MGRPGGGPWSAPWSPSWSRRRRCSTRCPPPTPRCRRPSCGPRSSPPRISGSPATRSRPVGSCSRSPTSSPRWRTCSATAPRCGSGGAVPRTTGSTSSPRPARPAPTATSAPSGPGSTSAPSSPGASRRRSRCPLPADLLPPSLGRRLLSEATDDELTRIGARRVGGRDALGLRLVPAEAASSVGRVDVWVEPGQRPAAAGRGVREGRGPARAGHPVPRPRGGPAAGGDHRLHPAPELAVPGGAGGRDRARGRTAARSGAAAGRAGRSPAPPARGRAARHRPLRQRRDPARGHADSAAPRPRAAERPRPGDPRPSTTMRAPGWPPDRSG